MRVGVRHWVDIRPEERRCLWLSVLGAFLAMAGLTLARALREALYLSSFDVRTLPYITAAVAALSLPLVGAFTKLLERHPPRTVLRAVVLVEIGGLVILWPFAAQDIFLRGLIVIFYIWTALGILLIASGFWVVTAELFAVRGAKRLYGLITAGGTAGAMAMGISLSWLTGLFRLIWLLPLLIAVLLAFLAAQAALPRGKTPVSHAPADRAPERSSPRENVGLIWRTPHLRVIALIVVFATVASTLLDYQFKEAARSVYGSQEALTGFLGAFYGWTGAVALFIQLVVATRLISVAGIGLSLAVLPVLLLLGSASFAILPGLLLITLVRGADNSLRKSLFRPVIEYLYVPLSAALRRKTKTFIDSVVDSAAEGSGAAVVFVWVTLLSFPSRYLSVFVIVLSAAFLLMSRRMDRQYLSTIVSRLKEEVVIVRDRSDEGPMSDRRLLSASFTQMDVRSILREEDDPEEEAPRVQSLPNEESADSNTLVLLQTASAETLPTTLVAVKEWDRDHVAALTRLLARDALKDRVAMALRALDEISVPHLSSCLRDERTDFVIRRRIPRVLAASETEAADDALLDVLTANRFEVRYRACVALYQRREKKLPESKRDWRSMVWRAIESEVKRDRPVWELQRLLDDIEATDDDLVGLRVGARGALSLEHTFRMLSMVLDPEPVRAAFLGIVHKAEELKSFALEYLEQVLPNDIRRRLWLFIGDISDHQREQSRRSINAVVSDLMSSRATLFAGDLERDALKRILERDEEDADR